EGERSPGVDVPASVMHRVRGAGSIEDESAVTDIMSDDAVGWSGARSGCGAPERVTRNYPGFSSDAPRHRDRSDAGARDGNCRPRAADLVVRSIFLAAGAGRAAKMTRILIVDDDFEVLALLEDIVSSLGYEVRTTTSGEVAVALVHAFQPGAVLLDLVMPSPAGAEVLASLRRIDPEL